MAALGPPPRALTWNVRARARFGGTMPQVGWALVAAGMLPAVVLVGRSELITMITFIGETEHTGGVVIDVSESNASEHREPILAVRYRYSAGGRQHEGESYSVSERYTVGQRVAVEYLAWRPASSRVAGLRKRPIGAVGSFVVVFVLAGSLIVGSGLLRTRHYARLLRHGRRAVATLFDQSATAASVDDEPVLRLRFRFEIARASEAADYRGAAAARESYEVEHCTERADDFAGPQDVLYDPSDPSRALLIKALPGIRVTPEGRLEAMPGAALLLLTPAASLAGLLATMVVAGI